MSTILNEKPSCRAVSTRLAFGQRLVASQATNPFPVWLLADAEGYDEPFSDSEWELINARLRELSLSAQTLVRRFGRKLVDVSRLSYEGSESGEGEGDEQTFTLRLSLLEDIDEWELEAVHYNGLDVTGHLTPDELNALCYAAKSELP